MFSGRPRARNGSERRLRVGVFGRDGARGSGQKWNAGPLWRGLGQRHGCWQRGRRVRARIGSDQRCHGHRRQRRRFGTGIGTTLRSGGVEFVFSGGSALGTIISNSYEIVSSGGKAAGTVVSGGAQLIYGSAVASSTLLNGGAEYVMSGGSASGTTVSSGSVWIYGTAINTTLLRAATNSSIPRLRRAVP